MKERGFTLIEMVLAVTLFSFLMTSYYVVFIRVVELEEYARNQRAFASIGPAVLDLVEDDLLSLYTHPREPTAFPFRGTDNSLGGEPADRVDFVARRMSIHQEEFHGNDNWVRSPINEVGYRMVRNLDGLGDVRRLFRREHYYVDETPLQGGDYYEIYDRVIAFDLVYAGYQVEEEDRASLEEQGENELDKFESWDSEERRGFPSAVIVTLTVEPPQLSVTDRAAEKAEGERRRRTFVRVIPLTHAEDVPYPEAAPGGSQPGSSR
jgi:prepilin-type N-terminal cleavage/methylation domain-containing protein